MLGVFFGFANKVCDMCVLERYALRWLFGTIARALLARKTDPIEGNDDVKHER